MTAWCWCWAAGPLAPEDIVFADAVEKTIVRFNPITGNRDALAPLQIRDAGGGIAVTKSGDVYGMVNVLGASAVTVFSRLNFETGQMEPISNERLIQSAGRMTLSPDERTLMVAGTKGSALEDRGIFKVDVATGKQSMMAIDLRSTFMGLVPAYERPYGLAYGPDGAIYMLDNAYAHIVKFNADGTSRQLIVELPAGWLLGEIAVDDAGIIYVTALNMNPNGVVRIDPSDGSYRPLTQGGNLSAPIGLGIATDGALIVGDASTDLLVRVDAVTGEQTVLLENVPSARSIWVFKGNDVSEPPRLSVRFTGTIATITWADPDDLWQLQVSNDLLNPASWSDSTLQPLSTGSLREVAVEADGARHYFRLRKE